MNRSLANEELKAKKVIYIFVLSKLLKLWRSHRNKVAADRGANSRPKTIQLDLTVLLPTRTLFKGKLTKSISENDVQEKLIVQKSQNKLFLKKICRSCIVVVVENDKKLCCYVVTRGPKWPGKTLS